VQYNLVSIFHHASVKLMKELNNCLDIIMNTILMSLVRTFSRWWCAMQKRTDASVRHKGRLFALIFFWVAAIRYRSVDTFQKKASAKSRSRDIFRSLRRRPYSIPRRVYDVGYIFCWMEIRFNWLKWCKILNLHI
jgi:hypothetical protein